MIIGDASDIIPTLTDTYDIVFIDANKRDYLKYYELVLPKVRPEGFILADNTLWDGKVVTDPNSRDAQTIGIERFNDFIATDNRVEKLYFPYETDSRSYGKTIISPDIRGKTLLFIKTTYYGNNRTKQNKPTAPKELSDIFLAETRKTHGIIISVSVVRVSPDLSTAKAYLSIFPPEKSAEMIENINANTKTIRYENFHSGYVTS